MFDLSRGKMLVTTTSSLLTILVVLLLGSVFPVSAQAVALGTTFQVDSNGDEADAVPGDGICATAGGKCTLRAAIAEANASAGADVINIPEGLGTINPASILPDIITEMDIVGPGADLLAIDGGGAVGPLIEMTNPAGDLDLSGVTLTNAESPAPAYGGGVYIGAGAAKFDGVAVTNCRAYGAGGIEMAGGGTLTLTNSTISGNTATGDTGGGIRSGGLLDVINSTISGNSAVYYGGGIASWGTLTISNSTITGNTAAADSNVFGDGGGLRTDGTATIKSTIVADNFDLSAGGGDVHKDISGTVISEDYNHVGDATGLVWGGAGAGPNDVIGSDPGLDTLEDNGGATQTHALLPGSPAINTGNGTAIGGGAVTTDQRGRTRDATPDKGAYEVIANDLDDDGVIETEEDDIPDADGSGTGDGNGDGTTDGGQAHVCSLLTNDGANHVCIATDGAGHPLRDVSAMAAPADAPAEATYPYGMFSFKITGVAVGGTVNVDIYTPYNADITGYWKKGNDGVWADVATNITDVGTTKTKITLSLTDGGAFDRDGAANGVIVDPGGPAVTAATPGVASSSGGCFIDLLTE